MVGPKLKSNRLWMADPTPAWTEKAPKHNKEKLGKQNIVIIIKPKTYLE